MRFEKVTELFNKVVVQFLLWASLPRATLFFAKTLFWFLGMHRKKDKIDLGQLKRVLVIRLDGIGDIVLTGPFLRELRKNIPNAWITLIVKPEVCNLVEKCPYVNEVLTFDGKISVGFGKLRKHFCALGFAAFNLWKRKFDLAVIPRWDIDHYHASFLAFFSRAPIRVAYSEYVEGNKHEKNRGYDELFSHIILDRTSRHEVARNLEPLKFLGGKIEDCGLELWLDKKEQDTAEKLFKENNVEGDTFLIGIAPGAQEPRKIWPKENFLEITKWLLKRGSYKIIFFGGEKEIFLGEYIKNNLEADLSGRIIDITGKTTLRQLACLIKRCKFYIGNDSGIMHIAAAAKVPLVEISSWPKNGSRMSRFSSYRFGPWQSRYILVSPEKGIVPCKKECVNVEAHCILQIKPEYVKKAIEDLETSFVYKRAVEQNSKL